MAIASSTYRPYGNPDRGDARYRFGAMATIVEGARFECKELDVTITAEKLANKEERERLAEAIVSRVAENVCAALNARCDLTIYLGITDGGRVQGIRVPLELVVTVRPHEWQIAFSLY